MTEQNEDGKREILVFRHEKSGDLGNFEPVLEDSGIPWRYVDFWDDPEVRPSVEEACGLIVLGGPMSCYDVEEYPFLSFEQYFINRFHRFRRPILGICLGAQLINATFNCVVQVGEKEPEVGFAPVFPSEEGERDPLLNHFSDRETLFHFHRDYMDEVPVGGRMLASSTKSYLQAFRLDRTCYAIQFHPEVDAEILEDRWLNRERIRKQLEASPDVESIDAVRERAQANHDRIRRVSQEFFTKWLDLVREHGRGNHWGEDYSFDTRGKHAPPPSERMG